MKQNRNPNLNQIRNRLQIVEPKTKSREMRKSEEEEEATEEEQVEVFICSSASPTNRRRCDHLRPGQIRPYPDFLCENIHQPSSGILGEYVKYGTYDLSMRIQDGR